MCFLLENAFCFDYALSHMYRLVSKEENITHGQRHLLDLLDKRKLMGFCRERNLEFTYTFQIAVGTKLPPLPTFVYRNRDIIGIDEWFYKESEPVPLARSYIPYDPDEKWDYTTSMAFITFSKIENLKQWCRDRSLISQYVSFTLITKKQIALSYNKIMALREYFRPSDWFYRPDEILK